MKTTRVLAALFSVLLFMPLAETAETHEENGSAYPEANPFNAFNVDVAQKINISQSDFFTRKIASLVRFTATFYVDDNSHTLTSGFVAMTYGGPDGKENTTYYYNAGFAKKTDPSFVITLFSDESWGWGVAYRNIVPRVSASFSFTDLAKEIPPEGKMLWVSEPFGFTLKTREQGGYSLHVMSGGQAFQGVISFPVGNVKRFYEMQNGRLVAIFVAEEIGAPFAIDWIVEGEKGTFKWEPGFLKPKFVAVGIDA